LGLSVKDFCANQSVSPSIYYYWKKKLQDPGAKEAPGSFVPLIIGSTPASGTSRIFVTLGDNIFSEGEYLNSKDS
jgi:hypothetical protein